MSTMLEEKADHWVVSTLVSVGRRRKVARGKVRVPKGDKAALKTELLRQAVAARAAFGIIEDQEVPVV